MKEKSRAVARNLDDATSAALDAVEVAFSAYRADSIVVTALSEVLAALNYARSVLDLHGTLLAE